MMSDRRAVNRATASNQIASAREAGTVCPLCEGEIRAGEAVATCNACGTVHHRTCWDRRGQCGSYACSSGRTSFEGRAALVVTADELARAVPLPRRTPPPLLGPGWTAPAPEPTRTSRLAIAAFVCALAGIPLFGLITGMLAIVLGSLALVNVVGTRLRGTSWAIAGIALGLADVVGWVIFLFPLIERRIEH
jgi:Prokaryotic RING finger family 1/Domain of unknown function (DUF4190)